MSDGIEIIDAKSVNDGSPLATFYVGKGTLTARNGDVSVGWVLEDWVEFHRQLGNAILLAQGVVPKAAA